MKKEIKKIVLLVHNLSGGGAERVAALWATGFADRGYETHILTSEPASSNDYPLHSNVFVSCLGLSFKSYFMRGILNKLGISRFVYLRNLNRILHSIKPDVCIGVLGTNALDAYNLTRDTNTLVIQTEHNAYDRPDFVESNPEVMKMKFEINKIFDKVTVLTEADTKVPGVPTENMVVLPNPLTFAPVKEIPKKENVVLAVGRLDVWKIKGFDNLIAAWGKIANNYPKWKLQIAGTGSQKSKDFLVDLVNQYNISNQVEFLGFKSDVIDLYKKASIFVLSSRNEGFGMVLTEAMSQGCACIACDFGGRQREIITSNKEGLVCSGDNIEELSAAIEKMISDNDYRESCRVPAIERSSYYSLKNTMDRWETIFKEINLQ